jgi:hypothetical protein
MKKELSNTDLTRLFGVSRVTLHHWRKGTARKTALPSHLKPKGQVHVVYYKWVEVKAWAKQNDMEINLSKAEPASCI